MAVLPGALTPDAIGDLVISTLRDLGRPKFQDISSNLQEHTAMRNLLKKNRIAFQSGRGIQWNVMIGQTNAAANVGLGATDNVSIVDVMTQGTTDWRNTSTNYATIGQEIAMNREPARITDLLLERRIGSLISMAELMESNFWGPPVVLADTLTPYGVNTWLCKSATQGFNGLVPSGFTTIGGINPTTVPNWANWTDAYVLATKDDLIRKWRRAATFTHFKPTVDGIPTFNTGDEYGFYTNYGVIGPLEEALEAQNDDLGNDVASKDGMTIFRRVPVMWVPLLERDTTNPVYGINWAVFKTMILEDWWLKETVIPHYPGQHTLTAYFMDCTYNWTCKDRRRNMVLATGTTYPS
jgi:hypothetical protein